MWLWCASDEPNSNIINKYVYFLFSDIKPEELQSPDFKGDIKDYINMLSSSLKKVEDKLNTVKFNTEENAERLRKCLLFNDILLKCNDEIDGIEALKNRIRNNINNENYKEEENLKELINQTNRYYKNLRELFNYFSTTLSPNRISCYSAQILPGKTTDKIINILNKNVTISDRDVLGRYRKTDVVDKNITQNGKEQSKRREKNGGSSFKNIPNDIKDKADMILKSLGIDELDRLKKRIDALNPIDKNIFIAGLNSIL